MENKENLLGRLNKISSKYKNEISSLDPVEEYKKVLRKLCEESYKKEILFYKEIGFNDILEKDFESYCKWWKNKANRVKKSKQIYYAYISRGERNQNSSFSNTELDLWIQMLSALYSDFNNFKAFVSSGVRDSDKDFFKIKIQIKKGRKNSKVNSKKIIDSASGSNISVDSNFLTRIQEKGNFQSRMKKLNPSVSKNNYYDFLDKGKIPSNISISDKEEILNIALVEFIRQIINATITVSQSNTPKTSFSFSQVINFGSSSQNQNQISISPKNGETIEDFLSRITVSLYKYLEQEYGNDPSTKIKISNKKINLQQTLDTSGMVMTREYIDFFTFVHPEERISSNTYEIDLAEEIAFYNSYVKEFPSDVNEEIYNGKKITNTILRKNPEILFNFLTKYMKIENLTFKFNKIGIKIDSNVETQISNNSRKFAQKILKYLSYLAQKRHEKEEIKKEELENWYKKITINKYYKSIEDELTKVIYENARKYLLIDNEYLILEIKKQEKIILTQRTWFNYVTNLMATGNSDSAVYKKIGSIHELIFNAILNKIPELRGKVVVSGQTKNEFSHDLFSDIYVIINGEKIGFQLKGKTGFNFLEGEQKQDHGKNSGEKTDLINFFGKGVSDFLTSQEKIRLRIFSLVYNNSYYNPQGAVSNYLTSLIPKLYRLKGKILGDNKDFMNNFFVINFRMIPTSIILYLMIEKIEENNWDLKKFFYEDNYYDLWGENVHWGYANSLYKKNGKKLLGALDDDQFKEVLEKDEGLTYNGDTVFRSLHLGFKSSGIIYYGAMEKILTEILQSG